MCEILEEMIYPNSKSFIWRSHVGAGNQISEFSEFFYESVFSSLGELIKISKK